MTTYEGGWWEGGVKRAVDEFFERNRIQVVEIRNGQFVLRKDAAPGGA
jgi:hypothetical protein